MRFAHTNIVAADFRLLSEFYQAALGCTVVPPERDLRAPWLAAGTGVAGASLRGVHLRLPGHGERGPTLEIFQYGEALARAQPLAANRLGYGHIAFEVDDVAQVAAQVLASGGTAVGEIVHTHIAGAGQLTFTYVADPEGNIIELQSWSSENPTPTAP